MAGEGDGGRNCPGLPPMGVFSFGAKLMTPALFVVPLKRGNRGPCVATEKAEAVMRGSGKPSLLRSSVLFHFHVSKVPEKRVPALVKIPSVGAEPFGFELVPILKLLAVMTKGRTVKLLELPETEVVGVVSAKLRFREN